MQVILNPELERIVQDRIHSGQYRTPEEVIREALTVLSDRDRLWQERRAERQQQLAVGLEQADRGELVDGAEVFRQLKDRFADTPE